jgi:hypothetical protein
MNEFEQLLDSDAKCKKCGKTNIFLHGGGWDYDRIYCSDRTCDTEREFTTTTEAPTD